MKKIVIFISIIIFSLQFYLQELSSVFRYFDEFFCLSFFAIWIFHKKGKFRKSTLTLFIIAICIVSIGLLGNCLNLSRQGLFYIVQDIVSNLKIFLVFIPLFDDQELVRVQGNLSDWISRYIRMLLLIMFICCVISQFIDIGMSGGARYGLMSFAFIFGNNPSNLNTMFYYYMLLFTLTMTKNGKIRKNSSFFVVVGVITWIFTLRTRAFAFACLYLILCWYFLIVKKNNRKLNIKWYHLIPIGFILVLIGMDSFEFYFIENPNQARSLLLRGALQLASERFPLGTGFATFGTEASCASYSSVYYYLGFANHWAMNPDRKSYLLDQYWAAIIGQFGVLGVSFMFLFLKRMYMNIYNSFKNTSCNIVAGLFLIITSLVSSLTAASYIQASFIGSIFAFYCLLNNYEVHRYNTSDILLGENR